ncbi:hypothetical protein HMPREF1870_00678 [Bacteroidales bacterium KA00344]|nr:hypothetical protein HMPREF1870_00678 [Bacteroidales bacterium KA00344]
MLDAYSIIMDSIDNVCSIDNTKPTVTKPETDNKNMAGTL